MKSNEFKKLTIEELKNILTDNGYLVSNKPLNPIDKMLDLKVTELLNSEIIKEFYGKKENKQ